MPIRFCLSFDSLVFRGFDTKSKIAKIRAPLLFFHGDRDEIIPLKLGRRLFEAAPEPKWFVEVPGAGHNDLVETAGSAYRERLYEFVRPSAITVPERHPMRCDRTGDSVVHSGQMTVARL